MGGQQVNEGLVKVKGVGAGDLSVTTRDCLPSVICTVGDDLQEHE